ncbi:MAG: hypothetical protein IK107_03855 [Oscillospiraceae bacterium]|nr:hypothetical protein [Oscillospiraceae bacterium]
MRRFTLSAVLAGMAAAFTVTAGIAAFSAGGSDRPGDVNVDTLVNVADAILLARYCAEDAEAVVTAQGVRNADCNRDGLVGSDDSRVMLSYLAGLNHDLDVPEPPETTAEPAAETTDAPPAETTDVTSETTALPDAPGGSGNSAPDLTGASFVPDSTEPQTGYLTTEPEKETAVSQTTVPDVLTVGGKTLPLGRAAEEVAEQPELTDPFGPLTEKLTLRYNGCVTDFYVYAEDSANTLIMFSRDGIIIGYYTTATEYTCSSQNYTVTGYIDTYSEGTGGVYAVIALHTSAFLGVDSVADPEDLSVFSKLSFYVTNAIRGINGAAPLRWNDDLAACARQHSLALAEHNGGEKNQEHLDPETGANPTERIIAAVGRNCKPVGENVDKGYRHPFISAHKWYISERGHRATMLSPKFTDLGVGFAYLPQSNIYGTQDYAALRE